MQNNDIKEILSYGLGKRKTALAKVCFYKGCGQILINKKNFENCCLINLEEKENIKKPLIFCNLLNTLNINIEIKGGGIFAQIDAIKLAICNALVKLNKTYKIKLKQALFLKNDSRIKERRKYGLKKARKAPQYSKR